MAANSHIDPFMETDDWNDDCGLFGADEVAKKSNKKPATGPTAAPTGPTTTHKRVRNRKNRRQHAENLDNKVARVLGAEPASLQEAAARKQDEMQRRAIDRIPKSKSTEDEIWLDCATPATAMGVRQAERQKQMDRDRNPGEAIQLTGGAVFYMPEPNAAVKTTLKRSGILEKSGSHLQEEDDEGSVEYKWRLVGISPQRLQHLVTQMKFRVSEGQGECIYELGVEDDGYARGLNAADFAESLETIERMAAQLNFVAEVIHVRVTCHAPLMRCAEIRVRKVRRALPTCRTVVVGELAAGKSTLVGVIASGELDDGNGTVRQSVFNHKHEFQTGQTSSVSTRVLGFTHEGLTVNYKVDGEGRLPQARNSGNKVPPVEQAEDSTECLALDRHELTDEAIVDKSATLCKLLDLPGHSKHHHTVLSTLLGRFPHVALLVVDPLDVKAAKTHVQQVVSLNLPFVVVMTKHDLLSPVQSSLAIGEIDALIRSVTVNTKHLTLVTDRKQIADAASGALSNQSSMKRTCSADLFMGDFGDSLDSDGFVTPELSPTKASTFPATAVPSSAHPIEQWLTRTVPTIVVSCVTGHGLDILREMLFRLSAHPPQPPTLMSDACRIDDRARMLVHNVQKVSEAGYVVSGIVANGSITCGQTLWWGPWTHKGAPVFCSVTVQSIHVQRVNVREALTGTDASFAIGKHLPKCVDITARKGTVFWAGGTPPTSTDEVHQKENNDHLPAATRAFEVACTNATALAATWLWKEGQEVLVYVASTRQLALIKHLRRRHSESDETAEETGPTNMTLVFSRKPELLWEGASVVLVHPAGRNSAVTGTVTSLGSLESTCDFQQTATAPATPHQELKSRSKSDQFITTPIERPEVVRFGVSPSNSPSTPEEDDDESTPSMFRSPTSTAPADDVETDAALGLSHGASPTSNGERSAPLGRDDEGGAF